MDLSMCGNTCKGVLADKTADTLSCTREVLRWDDRAGCIGGSIGGGSGKGRSIVAVGNLQGTQGLSPCSVSHR